MATTKERILITLAPSTARALNAYAKSEQTPRATIVSKVLDAWAEEEKEEYITPKERRALVKLLKKRDVPNAKYLSSKEFWKKVALHA
jgi:hypothetical protein